MTSNAILTDSPLSVPVRQAESRSVHVLTLTPFFPSCEDEVNGCFVKEPLDFLRAEDVTSSVIAVSPIHHPRKNSTARAAAEWVRYPQIPGTMGLASAGRGLDMRLRLLVNDLHRRKPIDIIHAHAALPCGHAALLMAQRLKVPYVVTVHGLDVFNSCYLGGAGADWRRRTSVAVYESAAAVVCVSRKVREILCEGMPSGVRSSVVYNGTDAALFSPGPASLREALSEDSNAPRRELLIVGNLIASKGQELVLRAMHRMSSAFPQLGCRIVGEGPDRARIEQLAVELGIGQRVHFMGRRNRRDVAQAMQQCSLFVLASRNEGLGCVYLEAMACAKPVIGCRGQGIEEIIKHGKNGWLVSGDDVDELADSITALLRSPELASQIGLAARQTVLNGLTLSHQAHNLATLYRAATVLGARDGAL